MSEFGSDRSGWVRERRRVTRVLWLVSVAAVLMCLALVVGLAGWPMADSITVAQDGEPPLDRTSAPVRITLPGLGIDLPVVSSERNVPGNQRGYPLCDVAQYWTRYDLPGAPGTAWVYAHAQPGMFLPMLLRAEATSGNGLMGELVTLQLRDGRLLRYRISEVKQRAYNQAIALGTRPGQQRLVLQTSEGPPGTPTRLQVAARLVGASWTDEPAPKAEPRACWQPRATQGGGKKPRATASAAPTDVEAGEPIDGVTLVMGGGAVLVGATLVAIFLVRRPASRPSGRR